MLLLIFLKLFLNAPFEIVCVLFQFIVVRAAQGQALLESMPGTAERELIVSQWTKL